MPSPRAILRDIVDHGLDPTIPHDHIVAGGRLGLRAVAAQDDILDDSDHQALIEQALSDLSLPAVGAVEEKAFVLYVAPHVEASVVKDDDTLKDVSPSQPEIVAKAQEEKLPEEKPVAKRGRFKKAKKLIEKPEEKPAE